MPKLPIVSYKELIKLLQQYDYEIDHQRGSHIILRHQNPPHRRLTVPDHREVAKGTLRAIIRESGLTVEEFRNLL